MQIDFEGRVVLITGATKGIGKQVAYDMGSLGAELITTGTNEGEIARLNKESIHHNPPHHWHSVDFTNKKVIEAFLQQIEKYERIDVLINNAGINHISPIDEIQESDWRALLAVNLDGPFLTTMAVSRIMKKNGYGRIINVSSVFGVISKEKRAAYSVTKFGIRGLTAATALDLAPYNILVNTVSPGFVDTDLTRKILGEKGMQEMASKVPMARLASPEEISRIILFLASDLNTYMTGQNIIVDGGFVNA